MESQALINSEQQQSLKVTIQTYSNEVVKLYRNTIKIRDVDTTNQKLWSRIKDALNYAVVLSGMPQFLTRDEYLIMKDFLIAEYKDYSPEEIIIAFHKLSAGKLNIKDNNHFGKLSASYVGQVLKAYREYRNKMLAEKIKQEDQEQLIPEVSDESKRGIRKAWVKQCILKPLESYKETEQFVFDDNDLGIIFRMLWKRGKVTISPEQAEEYKAKAHVYMKTKTLNTFGKKSKELKSLIEKLDLLESGKDTSALGMLKIRASKLYMKDYLKLITTMEKDLEKWIEKMGMYEIIEGE